jgi:hypothetical protein
MVVSRQKKDLSEAHARHCVFLFLWGFGGEGIRLAQLLVFLCISLLVFLLLVLFFIALSIFLRFLLTVMCSMFLFWVICYCALL